jgi:hypothetical protein
VAVTATALAALLLLIAASRAEPTPPPPQTVPRGVPGGAGFCQVPEGWVACQLVTER